MNIIIDNIDFWDDFSCMKYWSFSKSYSMQRKKEETRNMIFSKEYIGAKKTDGCWGMIIKDKEGNFYLRSRTPNVEKTFKNKESWIPHIINELKNIPNETVLLGEIYKFGDEGSRKATAILNCLKEKSLERQKKTPLHFYCFDCLAWGGKNLIDTPIIQRINFIQKVKEICGNTNFIEYAEYKEGEELWDLYTDLIAQGYEGVVIQKKTAPYTRNLRTARLSLKLKKELTDTIDAFLDGDYKAPTKEYTGKQIEVWNYWYNVKSNEKMEGQYFAEYTDGAPIIPITKPYFLGYAGALSFSVMKDGKPEHIAYISGVSDEMKRGIVQEPDKWIGQVYSLTAMEVEKIDGQYSLRHGKVVERRTDKLPKDCEWSQIESN